MPETQFTTTEEWRPVVGYEGLYEISSRGRVRSFPRKGNYYRGRILKFGIGRGYLQVRLCRDGKLGSNKIHTLVAAAFIGPRPNATAEIRHLDGNKGNNNPANLKYGTKSENSQDRLRHGRHYQANKTHCVRGHPYNVANTRIRTTKAGGKWRVCLACWG